MEGTVNRVAELEYCSSSVLVREYYNVLGRGRIARRKALTQVGALALPILIVLYPCLALSCWTHLNHALTRLPNRAQIK